VVALGGELAQEVQRPAGVEDVPPQPASDQPLAPRRAASCVWRAPQRSTTPPKCPTQKRIAQDTQGDAPHGRVYGRSIPARTCDDAAAAAEAVLWLGEEPAQEGVRRHLLARRGRNASGTATQSTRGNDSPAHR
jgi:hypothetical protein